MKELTQKLKLKFRKKFDYLEKNGFVVRYKLIIEIDENENEKSIFNIIYLNQKTDRGVKIIYSFDDENSAIHFKEPNHFSITILKELSGGGIEDTINLTNYFELNKKIQNAYKLASLNYYKGTFDERLELFLDFIYDVFTTDLKDVINGKKWIEVNNWHPYK